MKKVLFVATVVKTHIMEFHLPYLKMFQEKGWKTAVAARNDYENLSDCNIPYCDSYYDVPFERFPLKPKNIKSYLMLKKVMNENHYDIIHCHTPVGAMLARLAACKTRRNGTKVIYTAHGFHFYKGAPLINWLVYFPVEWICSFMTDTLITINQEDYAFAKKHMHAKKIEYVSGVGIDLNKFNCEKIVPNEKRQELGVPDDKIWILNVGELIHRKNQSTLIKAVSEIPNAYLTIAGRGVLENELRQQIKEYHLNDRVELLGYRTDISKLCQAADVFAFPSFQEGLSVALMEAMACGKPIVCSRIRGNIDLVDQEGGELFDPYDVKDMRLALERVIQRDKKQLGIYNREKIQAFGIEKVMSQMWQIYSRAVER